MFRSEPMLFQCRLTFNYFYVWRFLLLAFVLFCFCSIYSLLWAKSCERIQGKPIQFISLVYFLVFFSMLVSGRRHISIIPILGLYNIHFYSSLFRWVIQLWIQCSVLRARYRLNIVDHYISLVFFVWYVCFSHYLFAILRSYHPSTVFLVYYNLVLSFEIRASTWTRNHFSYITFIRIKWNSLNRKWRQTMIVAP